MANNFETTVLTRVTGQQILDDGLMHILIKEVKCLDQDQVNYHYHIVSKTDGID